MNDPDSSRVEDLCHSGAFGCVCHSRQGEPRGLLALPRVRCARRQSESRCQRFSCQRSRTLSPSDGEKSLEHRFSFVGLIHLILVLWTVKSFFPKFGFEIPEWNRRGDSQLPRWFVPPTPFVASTVGKVIHVHQLCTPSFSPELQSTEFTRDPASEGQHTVPLSGWPARGGASALLSRTVIWSFRIGR